MEGEKVGWEGSFLTTWAFPKNNLFVTTFFFIIYLQQLQLPPTRMESQKIQLLRQL